MNYVPQNFSQLSDYMADVGQAARQASRELAGVSRDTKTKALHTLADTIEAMTSDIIQANREDVSKAAEKQLSAAMIDRLTLNKERIASISASVRSIADQPDPIGHVLEEWEQPNGLTFKKVSVPLGVIGMIYESRPNVTADAAALCLKSGNAVILRGGSEAVESNRAIYKAVSKALDASGLPKASVQLIATQDRDAVGLVLGVLIASNLLSLRKSRAIQPA